jgi:uncharacterized protein involved in exopolysaccharide biosynthesis
MTSTTNSTSSPAAREGEARTGLLDVALLLLAHRRLLLGAPLLLGVLAVALTFAVSPTYTARALIMPPQQQSLASSALASLGSLGNLIGSGSSIKNPLDEYASLMQSVTVSDHIIDRFGLMKVYDQELRVNTRLRLGDNVHILVGKKDGLISIEVDDTDPKRAAAMANSYIDELRWITEHLALTEAQQRRAFFEGQLKLTRDRLTAAQVALQGSGIDVGALKSEPGAAAVNYARLQSEKAAAEVRLQVLRQSLSETAPEVLQQKELLAAVSGQLSKLEASSPPSANADYVSRFREFKYQEMLFELFAKQYELARVDESREGPLVQVVDTATPPERKSRPHRALVGLETMLGSFLVLSIWVASRRSWRAAMAERGGATTAGSPPTP